MPIRLYNPDLEPPHNECVVMDDNQVAILADSGWKLAPEPDEPAPGFAPEPVRYEPVKKATAAKKARPRNPPTDPGPLGHP